MKQMLRHWWQRNFGCVYVTKLNPCRAANHTAKYRARFGKVAVGFTINGAPARAALAPGGSLLYIVDGRLNGPIRGYWWSYDPPARSPHDLAWGMWITPVGAMMTSLATLAKEERE